MTRGSAAVPVIVAKVGVVPPSAGLTIEATGRAPLEQHLVEEVYLASTNKPNCWIDIGSVLDRKIAAMRMHASQVGDGDRVATMLRIRAEDAGKPRGIAHAESYHRIDMRPERRFKRSEPTS